MQVISCCCEPVLSRAFSHQDIVSLPAPAPVTPTPHESNANKGPAPDFHTSSPTSDSTGEANEASTPTPSPGGVADKPAAESAENGVAKEDSLRSGSGGWGEPRGKGVVSPKTPRTPGSEKSEELTFLESLPKLTSVSRRKSSPEETPEKMERESSGIQCHKSPIVLDEGMIVDKYRRRMCIHTSSIYLVVQSKI
jgi:hypothetical protein